MAVVDAALALYRAIGTKNTVTVTMVANDLQRATEKLIFSCSQCNTDRHLCPGCGTDIGHFEPMCDRCDFESASVQREDDSTARIPVDIIGGSSHPCVECMTDPDEDPHAWCDCGGRHDEGPCAPPCYSRAHKPEDCPNRGPADVAQEPVEPAPEYVPAEWQHVLAGDRVRLGDQEAEVTRSNVGTWHVDSSDRYRPRPWEHTEVSISLAHLDQPLIMAPGGPVEILADRERAAVLVLQKAFPLVTA